MYHQVYIQAVFAVKYRAAINDKTWQNDLFTVIGNLINETGCQTKSSMVLLTMSIALSV